MKRLLTLLLVALGAMTIPAQAQDNDWVRKSVRESCDFWGNCYPSRYAYRERQIERERAVYERRLQRERDIREWERCVEWGRGRCGPRPYSSDVNYSSADGAQCLSLTIEREGGAANTETGALNQAKRAMRSTLRNRFGERFQDLALAQRLDYKCTRVTTNESVLGAGAERVGTAFGFDPYQKRCTIRLKNPCQPKWETLKLNGKDED